MSSTLIDVSRLISRSQAAELRGCSRQAILYLIRGGKLKTIEIGGHLFLYRDEVMAFVPDVGGRPKGSKGRKKRAQKKTVGKGSM
jgi:excisionase family DNA binding protein